MVTKNLKWSAKAFLAFWLGMVMLIIGAAAASYSESAGAADPLMLAPGEEISVSCAAGLEDCPAPLPGNAHAVVHPSQAAADGGASCRECHQPGGEAVTAGQVMLCSQYPFLNPGVGSIVMLNPNTGGSLVDQVSGVGIATGGTIGGYDPGDEVACRDCHYPHQRGVPEPRDREIHAGCLDCHRSVGSDDLRRGVEDDD